MTLDRKAEGYRRKQRQRLNAVKRTLLMYPSSAVAPLVSGDDLVVDSFTGVNGVDLQDHAPDTNVPGNPWVVYSPNFQTNRWEIDTNAAELQGGFSQSVIAGIDVARSDELRVEATLVLADTNVAGHSGPGVRIDQPPALTTISGIFLEERNASAEIRLYEPDTNTVHATFAGPVIVGDVLRITMSGNTITGFQNGVQRVQVVTANHAGQTGVGILGSKSGANWAWDDFLAEVL